MTVIATHVGMGNAKMALTSIDVFVMMVGLE